MEANVRSVLVESECSPHPAATVSARTAGAKCACQGRVDREAAISTDRGNESGQKSEIDATSGR
eukprot:COSAG06_NODE_19936_length_817_cov_0.963788_2_plen_63_part_01